MSTQVPKRPSWWAEFALFLRQRPLLWLLPIALWLGLLAFLAWSAVQTPSSPYTYRLDF